MQIRKKLQVKVLNITGAEQEFNQEKIKMIIIWWLSASYS